MADSIHAFFSGSPVSEDIVFFAVRVVEMSLELGRISLDDFKFKSMVEMLIASKQPQFIRNKVAYLLMRDMIKEASKWFQADGLFAKISDGLFVRVFCMLDEEIQANERGQDKHLIKPYLPLVIDRWTRVIVERVDLRQEVLMVLAHFIDWMDIQLCLGDQRMMDLLRRLAANEPRVLLVYQAIVRKGMAVQFKMELLLKFPFLNELPADLDNYELYQLTGAVGEEFCASLLELAKTQNLPENWLELLNNFVFPFLFGQLPKQLPESIDEDYEDPYLCLVPAVTGLFVLLKRLGVTPELKGIVSQLLVLIVDKMKFPFNETVLASEIEKDYVFHLSDISHEFTLLKLWDVRKHACKCLLDQIVQIEEQLLRDFIQSRVETFLTPQCTDSKEIELCIHLLLIWMDMKGQKSIASDQLSYGWTVKFFEYSAYVNQSLLVILSYAEAAGRQALVIQQAGSTLPELLRLSPQVVRFLMNSLYSSNALIVRYSSNALARLSRALISSGQYQHLPKDVWLELSREISRSLSQFVLEKLSGRTDEDILTSLCETLGFYLPYLAENDASNETFVLLFKQWPEWMTSLQSAELISLTLTCFGNVTRGFTEGLPRKPAVISLIMNEQSDKVIQDRALYSQISSLFSDWNMLFVALFRNDQLMQMESIRQAVRFSYQKLITLNPIDQANSLNDFLQVSLAKTVSNSELGDLFQLLSSLMYHGGFLAYDCWLNAFESLNARVLFEFQQNITAQSEEERSLQDMLVKYLNLLNQFFISELSSVLFRHVERVYELLQLLMTRLSEYREPSSEEVQILKLMMSLITKLVDAAPKKKPNKQNDVIQAYVKQYDFNTDTRALTEASVDFSLKLMFNPYLPVDGSADAQCQLILIEIGNLFYVIRAQVNEQRVLSLLREILAYFRKPAETAEQIAQGLFAQTDASQVKWRQDLKKFILMTREFLTK